MIPVKDSKLALMIGIIVLSGFVTYVYGANNHSKQLNLSAIGITLEIDFGNETIITFTDLNGTDVLSVTESVIVVDFEWRGDLVFVNAIGGVSNNGGLWWQYWVNNEYGPVAANKYVPSDGDSISWKRVEPASQVQTNESPDFELIVAAALVSIIGSGFLAGLYLKRMRS